ncbi:MAG: MYXO-CTERM sorting domain-containing protein, partial [Myxococcota bacterium]
DAGAGDAGATDAGTSDAGETDAGEADSGTVDAGLSDGGIDPSSLLTFEGGGCGCSSPGALAPLAFYLMLGLALRRRRRAPLTPRSCRLR